MSRIERPADSRRLYQQVADKIRGLIETERFAAGCRLPAERDLAQKIGVSRPSLREALIALEIEGSVEIRMGSGVYVAAGPGTGAAPMRPMGESPSELMQARAALEGMVATIAAARMDEAALARLDDTLGAMRSEIAAGRKPLDQDRQFHLAIAEQTGNSVLLRLVTELFDERHGPIWARIRTRYESAQTWTAALAEHEAIVRAFAAADPPLAQAMMRVHLEASCERWIGAQLDSR